MRARGPRGNGNGKVQKDLAVPGQGEEEEEEEDWGRSRDKTRATGTDYGCLRWFGQSKGIVAYLVARGSTRRREVTLEGWDAGTGWLWEAWDPVGCDAMHNAATLRGAHPAARDPMLGATAHGW